jgi:hypothetical protein
MREQFLALFGNWINQYKTDIKNKVDTFLKENDSCPDELAYVIDVPVEHIYSILNGNGEDVPVSTFGKLLLASGFALRIEPIENTPLKTYDNVNPEIMRNFDFDEDEDLDEDDVDEDEEEDIHEEVRAPRPNMFARPPRPMGMGGMMPPHGFDPSRIPPHVRGNMDKEFERRSPIDRPMPKREEQPTSPFAVMGRNELCKIIRKKLWDSEIDLDNATTKELVHFLEEKDKRMKAYKNTEELERDPKVADFVKNMKKTIKENPQFRSYMKQYLKNLDVED